jgi:hypothetical protein
MIMTAITSVGVPENLQGDRRCIYIYPFRISYNFISGAQSLVNMHWQYYQKALTAYFAASNALGVEAQAQNVFRLPGDGGIILIAEE